MRTQKKNKTPLPPGKRIVFLFLSVGVIPLVLIGLMEGVARFYFDLEPSTFFIEREVEGVRWVTDNPFYGYTFFHPVQARLPAQNLYAAEKPDGTLRILVLGESAAMGFPRPEFGLARVLQRTIEERYPGERVDVIDGTMTMINTHMLREIAREGMRYDPDLVILYAGNNEAIGPYGPSGVFGSFYPQRWMIRFDRWLRTRSALVRGLIRLKQEGRDASAVTWRGLDYFKDRLLPLDEPALRRMHEYFALNLRDVFEEAEARGVPVIAAGAAVNLVDWPPLKSSLPDRVSEVQRLDWLDQYKEARALMQAENWHAALMLLESMTADMPEHAGSLYDLALCLWRLDRRDEAYPWFERAVDADLYRFRADLTMTKTIRNEAGRHPRAVVVDARRAFYREGGADPDFLEHVHLTPNGMIRLAELFADALPETGMERFVHAKSHSPELREMRDQLFLYPDIEAEAWEAVRTFLHMDVFRGQEGYADRLLDADARHQAAVDEALKIDADDITRHFESTMRNVRPAWRLNGLYARYMVRRNELDRASEALKNVIKEKPNHPDALQLLGYVEYQRGAPERAIKALEASLEVRPHRAETWNTLGLARYVSGSRDQALRCYEQALLLEPRHAGALNNLGYLLYESGQLGQAELLLMEAIDVDPGMLEARYHLAMVFMRQQRNEAALEQLQFALKENSGMARAWNTRGFVLLQMGDQDKAVASFQRALKEDPGLIEARINLAYIELDQNRPDRALVHLNEAIALRSDLPEVNFLYGKALVATDDAAKGWKYLKAALAAAPQRSDWALESANLLFEKLDQYPQFEAEIRTLIAGLPLEMPPEMKKNAERLTRQLDSMSPAN